MHVPRKFEPTMKQEQRIERLTSRMQAFDDLIARHKGFADALRGLDARHGAYLTPETVRRSAKEMAQEGRDLRVGIIGRVKAGKSSFLNALLFEGQNALPKAATPMTASLTMLGYADQPRAEIEFFTPEDFEAMAKFADEYAEKFERLVAEKEQQAQATPLTRAGRPASPPDSERIRNAVRRELDTDPHLGGANGLYHSIQDAGGLPADARAGKKRLLTAKKMENLWDKLEDYVGANGKFTPFTKCLSLFIPLPVLQDLVVVDTPGINDPIPSREKRTYDELHCCDVVLVVSPSGQFLNAQDLALMDRLTGKDGIDEIFLVASQIDSQLFGSERQKHGGHLPAVIHGLRQTLVQQAQQVLGAYPSHDEGLTKLRHELAERLVVTSAVAQTLCTQRESTWDENARHVGKMLSKQYPADCSSAQSARTHLHDMAGMAQTSALLDKVRANKQAVSEGKFDSFLEAQSKDLAKRLEQAPKTIANQRTKFEHANDKDLNEKLEIMRGARSKGTRVVNTAVRQVAQSAAMGLTERMIAEVHQLFAALASQAERAKGTNTINYTVETDGVLSSIARFFSIGGTENRTRTESTINAGAVRNALQELHGSLGGKLTDVVASARKELQQKLQKQILGSLREHAVIADKDIDTSLLAQACTQATARVRDFDDPVLNDLPDFLLQSGTLSGNTADRFAEMALYYARNLRLAAEKSAKKITLDFEKRLESEDIGGALFERYEAEIDEMKAKILDRAKTLRRYDQLLAELQELKRNG